ncbi:hypothetical protein Ptc2401_01419 [Prosthecochloris sp. CIB 2401]|nr:hypothetical protein Ptc2401_01419 [Prosthecochloris sp. CIB 2401]
MDGTSRHLSWFDQLKTDTAYADLLGTGRLASSHAVKRFFQAFSFCRIYQFRKVLQDLFIWRLQHSKLNILAKVCHLFCPKLCQSFWGKLVHPGVGGFAV